MLDPVLQTLAVEEVTTIFELDNCVNFTVFAKDTSVFSVDKVRICKLSGGDIEKLFNANGHGDFFVCGSRRKVRWRKRLQEIILGLTFYRIIIQISLLFVQA